MTSYFASHYTHGRYVCFFVHSPVLESTSKCNDSFYLFHTKIQNYHRVKRISADTPDWNLKFFYELSQKFKRFVVVVVVVSLNNAVQKGLSTSFAYCCLPLRATPLYRCLQNAARTYVRKIWFPFCTARCREKQQNTLLILINFNFQESVRTKYCHSVVIWYSGMN